MKFKNLICYALITTLLSCAPLVAKSENKNFTLKRNTAVSSLSRRALPNSKDNILTFDYLEDNKRTLEYNYEEDYELMKIAAKDQDGNTDELFVDILTYAALEGVLKENNTKIDFERLKNIVNILKSKEAPELVDYPNYKQTTYTKDYYWDGTIATDGCGPVSVSLVASALNVDADPVKAKDTMVEAVKNNRYGYGETIQIRDSLNYLGIATEPVKTVTKNNIQESIDDIRENLNIGLPVIVLVGKNPRASNPNKYTSKGHYMVLASEDKETGNLIIMNPGTTKNVTGTLEELVGTYMINTTRPNRNYLKISGPKDLNLSKNGNTK